MEKDNINTNTFSYHNTWIKYKKSNEYKKIMQFIENPNGKPRKKIKKINKET